MKVKTAIKKLKKLNPEAKLEFCTASGSESGKVTSISGSGKKVVVIWTRTTHKFGEKSL